jgi:hypothetical protein
MQAHSLRQALLGAWRPRDSAVFWRYEALRGPLRDRVVLVVVCVPLGFLLRFLPLPSYLLCVSL